MGAATQQRHGSVARSASLRAALLFALFLALVSSRRWQQFVSPQVWCEDGLVIRGLVTDGWRDLLTPLNGYLVLAPKVITRLSLAVSLCYYPLVSTVLASVFAALVGLAVALSPTHLRGRALCAACLFLLPSDSEVFALPLYAIWWAPVLLLLVALWDERDTAVWARLAFIAIGGLSSPFILAVVPILIARAAWHRPRRSEAIVAAAALAVASVQAYFVHEGAVMELPSAASLLTYVVPRFCGWFLGGNLLGSTLLLWALGAVLLSLFGAFLVRRRRDPWAWILCYLYVAAVACSVLRINPAALQPFRGGPRYFFFPFLLTFWILIQFALASEKRWVRLALGAACVAAALNAVPVWSRRHDDLGWREHVLSARLFPVYAVPIESDGNWFRAWSLELPGGTWDRLLGDDAFVSGEELARSPTFAYRVLPVSGDGPQYGISAPLTATNDGGRSFVRLRLSQGDRIGFRSGKCSGCITMRVLGFEGVFIPRLPMTTGWVTLEFSNIRLPRSFTVEIENTGQGVGEWAVSPAPGWQ